MTDSPKPKRGRPARKFSSQDGTEKTLAEIGISRQQACNWRALATLPKDVFEAALRDPTRKPTTARLVKLACELATTNRKAPMRDPSPLDEARKAAAKLSPTERIILLRELAASGWTGEVTP